MPQLCLGLPKALLAAAIGSCLAIPLANAEEAAAATTPAEATEPEFKPPPGFRPMKRGNKVVYCQKTTDVDSPRLMTEKCYDRVRLREIEVSMELQRREFEQRRRLCGVAC